MSMAAVSSREMITCIVRQPPSVLSAESQSPRPMNIDARGAPPEATKAEKAETMSISGMQTPMPVSARLPTSGMCPMYMRSTMLYSMLTSCAITVGTASLGSSFFIGCVPRNDLSSCILMPFLNDLCKNISTAPQLSQLPGL